MNSKTQNKKKGTVKGSRILVVALIVIGSITVLDNTIRLSAEMYKAVTHTFINHQWATVVVK